MKYFILLLLLCACPRLVHAQTAPTIARAAELREAGQFEDAQALLEAQLAQTEVKAEHDDLQNALADVHRAWAQQLEPQSDFEGAIAHYLKADETDKVLRRRNAASDLFQIGSAYQRLSRYEQALEFHNQALPIFREVKNRRGEADTLASIGGEYRNMSQYAKALEFYNQALPIFREIKNRQGEAATLNRVGFAYNSLTQYAKALEFYNQALPIFREIKNRQGEAATLINIGKAHQSMRQYEKALEFYNQALPLVREVKYRQGEADTLTSIGIAHGNLRQYAKALEFYNQALPIFRAIKNRRGEANTLNSIGHAYGSLRQHAKALEFYNQALPITRAIKYRQGEAMTLNNMMLACRAQKQPELAIFYGKQAVNVLQAIRGDIQTLDKESQRIYLAAHRKTYENLATLLMRQNRLEEAEQVLRLLRLEDAYEFVRRDPQLAQGLAALLQPLAFTPAEKAGLPADVEATVGEGALESQLWQKALQDREKAGAGRAALISTFNAGNKFYVLLSTTKGRRAFSVPIDKTEFDALSQRLGQELSHPSEDPQGDAEKMYRIVFCNGELEKALQDENIEVALWFASGSLRSIPIDALHDGRNYLIANPRANVNVTLTSRQLFAAQSKGAMLAAGASLPQTVAAPIAGEPPLQFAALGNVPREVRAIVDDPKHGGVGPFAGTILLNDDFSAADLSQALQGGVAELHIATHFDLNNGGDVNSFLLLGDGKTLPISQWKESLNLQGVGLLALSACETGVGRDGATGADVSSLGEISQWLGAQSVLVSLWPVADASTATLMGDFYRRWHDAPEQGKIAALRQAQRDLLGVTEVAAPDEKRQPIRETDDGETPTFVPDPKHPFAHPFYWAPFTLVGNWR